MGDIQWKSYWSKIFAVLLQKSKRYMNVQKPACVCMLDMTLF